MRNRLRVAALVIAVLVMACGPNIGDPDGQDPNGNQPDGGSPNIRPDGAPPALEAAVYAHSSTQLYRVDPETLEVSLVGNFQWPLVADEMTDIALDKDGNMTGISFSRVYSVDKDTAECTYLSDLITQFNGLSWVPANSPDPNAPEILVGAANNGQVVEINPGTGAQTTIGAYGGLWGSSGDMVAVRDFGILATVTDGIGTDRLASIDPTTWQATIIGDTGVGQIWGLGFWKNQVYGFTDTRQFVLIDVNTGVATPVETGAVNWWGAGVTTSAPVVD